MEEAGEPCGVEYYVRGVVQVTHNVRWLFQMTKGPNPPVHSQDATEKGGKRSSVNLSVSALASGSEVG